MAKTADTAKMAKINKPASETLKSRKEAQSAERTAAPTIEALNEKQRDDDDSVAGAARKATAEHASAAQDTAASHASEQAERIREAGESFETGSFAHTASERIADNLSEAARSIREADLKHLTDDLTHFARRQPLLFFGGAALLGFAAGRLLKASERAEHDDDQVVSQ